jgi:hypothetical protein
MNALAPATYNQNNDGWNDAANDASDRVGFLKCSVGLWSVGREGTEIAPGMRFVALSADAAWGKWKGGKPAEYRFREPGRALPHRETLGDNDAKEWDVGPDGKPKDPWQNMRIVHLVGLETAAPYTFSTSSIGGRLAVEELAKQIITMRAANPDALPIVVLSRTPMATRYGPKMRPFFQVVGWKRAVEAEPKLIELSETPQGGDVDDEIPF